MSQTLSRLQALTLGLVVLLGLGLGGYFLFAVGSRGWFGEKALNVRSGFKAVQGVEVGTRVRIQGIDAGEVVEIEHPRKAGEDVTLHLRVKEKYRELVLTSSTVRIAGEGILGGKVVEILPPEKPGPNDRLASEGTLLKSEPGPELTDTLKRVDKTLSNIQAGKGTVGKLLTDPSAYEKLLELINNSNDAVKQSKEAIATAQTDLEAIKRLPIIRNYISDPNSVLDRAGMERNMKYFAETELFEAGRSSLTANGKEKLKEVGEWANGFSQKGSEVVIVAYADPSKKKDAKDASHLTRQQADAVMEHLKKFHKIHKLGVISTRKVTALGRGNQPPPKSTQKLPPARVEVLVFVLQE